MAGTWFRMMIIYLGIGMMLHLGGIVDVSDGELVNPTGNFISYDPLNINPTNNNATGLNSDFESSVYVNTESKGLFGFIDTVFAVLKFTAYLLTGMVFTPILLFTTYQLPVLFTYIFGTVMMFGLILGFIAFIRSGLSP